MVIFQKKFQRILQIFPYMCQEKNYFFFVMLDSIFIKVDEPN